MSVTVEALLRRNVQTAINILLMLKKMSRGGHRAGLLSVGQMFMHQAGEDR